VRWKVTLPRRAFLGAELPPDEEAFTGEGVRIAGVLEDGMAVRAKLVAGDIVVAIAERPVRDFCELASALQSAHPKIQKMCEEESEDHEAVAKLFEINDSIHRTVERYKLMKKGDMEGAAKVAAGGPAPSQTASVGASANELSLIDFDAEAAGTNGSNGASQGTSQAGGLENDLLGLDIGGESSTYGQGGTIALGFGANQSELSWTIGALGNLC